MTLREVMNRVLRATGQPQIDCATSLLTEDNHLLILEFLNQFKEEIEAHNWRSLKETHRTTIAAGASFGFVGSAAGSTIKGTSRLLRVHDARFGKLLPLMYDVTSDTQPFRLEEMDLSLIFDKLNLDGGQQSEHSTYFSTDVSTANMLLIRVYPVPSTERTLGSQFIVPQDYLDVDDLDTDIRIPTRALVIGTVWAILQERGEELGQSSMWTEERYRTALDAEIATDMAEQGEPELVPV